MLSLLVDVGVGRAAEECLSAQGYDVLSVRDLDPRMLDSDFLSLAVHHQRLVITMDKDFGELVYHSGSRHAGVLLLRCEGATGSQKATLVKQIFTHYESELANHFSVYQNGRLRIRA